MDGKLSSTDSGVSWYKIRVSISVTEFGNIFYNGNKNHCLNLTRHQSATHKSQTVRNAA